MCHHRGLRQLHGCISQRLTTIPVHWRLLLQRQTPGRIVVFFPEPPRDWRPQAPPVTGPRSAELVQFKVKDEHDTSTRHVVP